MKHALRHLKALLNCIRKYENESRIEIIPSICNNNHEMITQSAINDIFLNLIRLLELFKSKNLDTYTK